MTNQSKSDPGSPPALPAALADLAKCSPLDRTLSEILAWLGSAEFQFRVAAIIGLGKPRTVGELALLLAMPPQSLAIWVGRNLAALVGEAVQVPLGDGPDDPVMEFRPLARTVN